MSASEFESEGPALPDAALATPSAEEPVCEAWPSVVQALIGVCMLAISALVVHYSWPSPNRKLQDQVRQLSQEVEQMREEQGMPSMILSHHRDSICYIYGLYNVGFDGQRPALRVRVSGTGFVTQSGLLVTNRHVAQPWFGDSESENLIGSGAAPHLEKLEAFFPGVTKGVDVTPLSWSSTDDLAVLKIEDGGVPLHIQPLPLAGDPPSPGEPVAVVGYPMGVLGMVAKSPQPVYQRLAFRHDDAGAASELAALSLIRPSATYGHLGDVVGDKLIYDAPTAHGGSGGPVFNSRGEVIGINAAFIDGFSGSTIGVSVQALRPLLEEARHKLND